MPITSYLPHNKTVSLSPSFCIQNLPIIWQTNPSYLYMFCFVWSFKTLCLISWLVVANQVNLRDFSIPNPTFSQTKTSVPLRQLSFRDREYCEYGGTEVRLVGRPPREYFAWFHWFFFSTPHHQIGCLSSFSCESHSVLCFDKPSPTSKQ